MKTVRRLLYRDIVASVAFVAVAFLSLFFFFDFVDELASVGSRGRTVWTAAQGALLDLPGHFYELFPIAVLIGSIYSLASLAQTSQFTILRTGGLSPGRALRLLAVLGLCFAAITWLVGDYVAPASDRYSALVKARINGGGAIAGASGGAGAWLKERRQTPQGERSYSVNVAGASASGGLQGIRIFEFEADGRLLSRTQAKEGRVGSDGVWTLLDAEVATWPVTLPAGAGLPLAAKSPAASSPALASPLTTIESPPQPVLLQRVATLAWPTTLMASVVQAAVLPASTMTTAELWRYSQHLSDQAQAAQTHEIRFWRKALYPLACLVMVALALPFAYLHARAGGVSLKVFGGIMLGISFALLNNLSGHIGLLRGWTPWVAAATPGGLYLLLSMAAFAWLVRYR
jgi:lipopolysaccharide export system permease protein